MGVRGRVAYRSEHSDGQLTRDILREGDVDVADVTIERAPLIVDRFQDQHGLSQFRFGDVLWKGSLKIPEQDDVDPANELPLRMMP